MPLNAETPAQNMPHRKHESPRKNRRAARLVTAGLAWALVGCTMGVMAGCDSDETGSSSDAAAPQAASTQTQQAEEETSIADAIHQAAAEQGTRDAQKQAQAVKQAIEQVTAPYGEAVSVTYLPVGRAEGVASVNGSTQHASASMIKLVVLAALLDKAAAGEVDLASQVEVAATAIVSGTGTVQDDGPGTYELRELARRMIADSDNTATNVIVDLIGMDAVNEEASKLGLTGTVMARKMMDTAAAEQGMRNRMTTDDAATILNLIATGQLVNQQMSDLAMDFLLQQTIDAGLTDAIPAGVSVAHKTGELLQTEHDGGIVLAAKPYVLVVMTEGIDNAAGVSVIADVSRAVYVATNGTDGVGNENTTAQGVQQAIDSAGGAQWAFDYDEPGVPYEPDWYAPAQDWAGSDEGTGGEGGSSADAPTAPAEPSQPSDPSQPSGGAGTDTPADGSQTNPDAGGDGGNAGTGGNSGTEFGGGAQETPGAGAGAGDTGSDAGSGSGAGDGSGDAGGGGSDAGSSDDSSAAPDTGVDAE